MYICIYIYICMRGGPRWGGPPPMTMVPSPPVVWYDNAVRMLKGASTMHTNNKDDRMSLTPLPPCGMCVMNEMKYVKHICKPNLLKC